MGITRTSESLAAFHSTTARMPKSLEKTRKKIAKKKGNITALHENSRDSQRLRRALMRDDKLIKVASARRKNDKPLVQRAAYFQEAIRANDGKPLDLESVQGLIKSYSICTYKQFETHSDDRIDLCTSTTKNSTS